MWASPSSPCRRAATGAAERGLGARVGHQHRRGPGHRSRRHAHVPCRGARGRRAPRDGCCAGRGARSRRPYPVDATAPSARGTKHRYRAWISRRRRDREAAAAGATPARWRRRPRKSSAGLRRGQTCSCRAASTTERATGGGFRGAVASALLQGVPAAGRLAAGGRERDAPRGLPGLRRRVCRRAAGRASGVAALGRGRHRR